MQAIDTARQSETETQISNVHEVGSEYEEDYEFEVLVQAYLRDVHYASKKQAIIKIFHAILNASIVVLPFAACHAGLPVYVALITSMAIISAYSSILIVRMASDQKIRTYEGLAEYAFGPIGFFLVCGCQILLSMTLMCISVDVFADIIDSVASEVLIRHHSNAFLYDLLTTRNSVVILGGLFVLPFCLYAKSMVSLSVSSYATMVAVCMCMVAVMCSFYIGSYNIDEPSYYDSLYKVKPNWWITLFVITLCFSYNQKAFVVYNCVKRRSPKRWRYSVQWSHLIIALVYIFLGSFGYLSDADAVIDAPGNGECRNRFNYFSTHHEHADYTLFHIARIVVAFSLLMAFPVDSLVAVTTYKRLYRRYQRFRQAILTGEYNNSYVTGSGDDGMLGNPEPQRDSLLFNLLEMPNRYSASNNESVITRISSALMPCFFTPRGPAQRSTHGESLHSNQSHHSHQSNHSYHAVTVNGDDEHSGVQQQQGMHAPGSLSQSVPGRISISELSSTGGSVSNGSNISNIVSPIQTTARSLPTPTNPFLSPPVTRLSDGRGSNSHDIEEGDEEDDFRGSSHSLSTIMSTPADEASLKLIQAEIQTELTINHIRGSNSRSNLTSISSSTSRNFVSTANVLTLPAPEVTIMDDEEDDGDERRFRESGFSSFGGNNRHSSLAAVHQQQRSFTSVFKDMIPAALMWVVCICGCLMIEKWVMFAGTIGTLCTSIMVFLLPSMIYFRVGALSDYQAAPILCNSILPNRLYMICLQILGLFGMLATIGLVVASIVDPSIYDYGYSDSF